MLKVFEFENSYCFRDRVKLDMSAELSVEHFDEEGKGFPVIPELHYVVRRPGGRKGILPVAAIYGKNASGKTMLLRTLHDVAMDALGETFSAAKAFSPLTPFEQMVENRHFLIADERKQQLSYSICVLLEDGEYKLDYSIGDDGVIWEKVVWRGLEMDASESVLYERNGFKLSPGGDKDISRYLKLMQERRERQLWFSLIAPAQEGLSRFYEWFRFVRDGLTFNESNHQGEKFEDIARRIAEGSDELFRKRLLCFLRCLDKSVADIKGELINSRYTLWLYHTLADNSGGALAHKISKESAGTRKLIEQFPLIDKALEEGMPFLCDELDRMLHPVAFKQLVRMFNSPEINRKNAQLIFSAHDTFPLDSNFLRSDEVYIIDKNEYSVSSIKRLSELDYITSYPDMEEEFRTGYYGSFPEDFHKSYGMAGEDVANT
jgi:hypothetical protein